MAKKISSLEDKVLIYNLYKRGFTQKKIADLNDVSQATISKIIKEMQYEEEIYHLKSMIGNQNNQSKEIKLIE